MDSSLLELIASVQRNCDISDAQHAGDYTLCVYLLKMCELNRWVHGFDLNASLDHQAIGCWVQQRETELEALEELDYQWLEMDGRKFAPLESEAVNQSLLARGLVYSGGLGPFGKPCFCLGRLLRIEQLEVFRVVTAVT